MYKDIYSREIQRNYKKIFEFVMRDGAPCIVKKRDKPQVAIVPMKYLYDYEKMKEDCEINQVLNTIREGEMEYKAGKAKELKDVKEILDW